MSNDSQEMYTDMKVTFSLRLHTHTQRQRIKVKFTLVEAMKAQLEVEV